ncbi:MAG: prepilin peptidase [Acidobacteriaceae bacterium]
MPIQNFIPIFAALVTGLVFGSFLNVCIARLPRHESIVAPGSQCRACHSKIQPWDNVPVLSWLLLGGRCRACSAAISLQYPLVELGTAALFVECVLQTGATWQTLMDAAACFLLLGLAVMDAQTMLLPDSFTLTGIGLAFVLKTFAPDRTNRGAIALRTLEDTAIAAAMLLLVWIVYRVVRGREGLGLGDVKLLAMVAAFTGLPLALFAYFIAVMAAAVYAMFLLARRKVTGEDRLAFGSFLAVGGIVAIFFGKPLLAWYLGLL